MSTKQESVVVTGIVPDLFGNSGLPPFFNVKSPLCVASSLDLLQTTLETAIPGLSFDVGRIQPFIVGSKAANISSIFSSPVIINSSDGPSSLTAIAQAAESLTRNKCDTALVITADNLGRNGQVLQGAAAVLQKTNALTMSKQAILSAGLSRTIDKTQNSTGSDLLLEACTRAQINPPDLSLLDVYKDETKHIKKSLRNLGPTFSRGKEFFPHCTIGPALPGKTATDVMRGFCALVIALYQRILPPLLYGMDIDLETPFCAASHSRPWLEPSPRRAAILSIGTRTESVLLLQEEPSLTCLTPPRLDGTWPSELVLFQAQEQRDLVKHLQALTDRIATNPAISFRELAHKDTHTKFLPCRVAIVAENSKQLEAKLHRIIERLSCSNTHSYQAPDGIYFADCKNTKKKTLFIFPGQGSQYLGMMNDLCITVPRLQRWLEQLQNAFDGYERCSHGVMVAPPEKGLSEAQWKDLDRKLMTPTGGGATSFVASLGIHELLITAGARPDGMLGYSNGENAALIASGAWRLTNRDQIFATVSQVCRSDVFDATLEETPRGCSLAVNNAPRDLISRILENSDNRLFLALDNCPAQIVLFGDRLTTENARRQLEEAGAICTQLPFDHGHHTPMFMSETKRLLSMYDTFDFGPAKVPIYSCANTERFPEDMDGIRELASWQWVRTVRFRETINRLYAEGFRCFVEVGPSSHLTSFIHNILRGHTYTAMATNVKYRPSHEQFLKALGNLFICGHQININGLRN